MPITCLNIARFGYATVERFDDRYELGMTNKLPQGKQNLRLAQDNRGLSPIISLLFFLLLKRS
jgi:hypothetical protein